LDPLDKSLPLFASTFVEPSQKRANSSVSFERRNRLEQQVAIAALCFFLVSVRPAAFDLGQYRMHMHLYQLR